VHDPIADIKMGAFVFFSEQLFYGLVGSGVGIGEAGA
jgi:hypothetical protein